MFILANLFISNILPSKKFSNDEIFFLEHEQYFEKNITKKLHDYDAQFDFESQYIMMENNYECVGLYMYRNYVTFSNWISGKQEIIMQMKNKNNFIFFEDINWGYPFKQLKIYFDINEILNEFSSYFPILRNEMQYEIIEEETIKNKMNVL